MIITDLSEIKQERWNKEKQMRQNQMEKWQTLENHVSSNFEYEQLNTIKR